MGVVILGPYSKAARKVINNFSFNSYHLYCILGTSWASQVLNTTTEETTELLGISKDGLNELISIYQRNRTHALGRPHILSPQEEVLLLIVFIRHHLVDVLLGSLFGVTKGMARRIRLRMIDFFYFQFKGKGVNYSMSSYFL